MLTKKFLPPFFILSKSVLRTSHYLCCILADALCYENLFKFIFKSTTTTELKQRSLYANLVYTPSTSTSKQTRVHIKQFLYSAPIV
jgi:hypothetical protein